LLDAADGTWRPMTQTFEPPPRDRPAAVYVDSLDRVLLAGGSPVQTNSCTTWTRILDSPVDTWLLDTETGAWEWLEVEAVPDRWGHAIAYDPEADLVVLFGGVGTRIEQSGRSELLGDTWIFDPSANAWDPVDSPIAPEPRACAGMVYDPGAGAIHLWGGQTATNAGDPLIWRFDAQERTWAPITGSDTPGPAPRWLHQMVHDPVTGLTYVIGGQYFQTVEIDSGTTTELDATDEVWAVDLVSGAWTAVTPLPDRVSWHAAATDGAGQITVFVWRYVWVYDTATGTWTDATPEEVLAATG
jgi:hypothetical protein